LKVYIEVVSHFMDNSDDITRVSIKPIEAREAGPYSSAHVKIADIPDSDVIEYLTEKQE
jgi:hypothetical protein